MANDKFYLRGEYIAWVCRNSGCGTGEQYIYNILNSYVILKAAALGRRGFFDRLSASCVQYLFGADAVGFAEADYYFNAVPGDFEKRTGKTMAALVRYAKTAKKITHKRFTEGRDGNFG